MFDAFHQIDWPGVLAGVTAFFLMGGLWFPFVVDRFYAAAVGAPPKGGALSIAGPLLCLAVITTANAGLMVALGIDTVPMAAGMGLITGIGYLLPMILNIAINPLFRRPFLYTALNAPYFIGGSALSCAIIALR